MGIYRELFALRPSDRGPIIHAFIYVLTHLYCIVDLIYWSDLSPVLARLSYWPYIAHTHYYVFFFSSQTTLILLLFDLAQAPPSFLTLLQILMIRFRPLVFCLLVPISIYLHVPNATSSEERSGAHVTGSEGRSCALRQSCRGAKAILEKRRSEQSRVEGKDWADVLFIRIVWSWEPSVCENRVLVRTG